MRKYCTIVAILSFGNVLSKEHTHNSTDVAEAERTENCTVKAHLPCVLFSYRNITDCSPKQLETRFPFIFANDNWPGKVSLLNANVTEEECESHEKCLKGIIFFTPPQNVGIQYIKGFSVMSYNSTIPCYIYDLSNATWKSGTEDFMTIFTLTMFPMDPNTLYALDVYPLPEKPPEFEHRRRLYIRTKRFLGEGPVNWSTSISAELKTDTREISVRFSPPPDEYAFSKFEIILWNYSMEKSEQKVYVNRVSALQTENCPCSISQSQSICKRCKTTMTEKFKFESAPLTTTMAPSSSDYISQSGTSRADLISHPGPSTAEFTRIPRVSYQGNKKQQTGAQVKSAMAESGPPMTTMKPSTDAYIIYSGTSTADLIRHPGSSTSTLTSHPGPVSEIQQTVEHVKIIPAVVGPLVGIGVVVLMLLCYLRRRRAEENQINHIRRFIIGNENENNRPIIPEITEDDLGSMVTVELLQAGGLVNSYNAKKVKMEHRPKIFILYEEDHVYHRKVVDSFALYMQEHCHCDVMLGQLSLEETWVHQEVQYADYVIIVNSELAFAVYKSLLCKHRGESEGIKIPGINCILQRLLKAPCFKDKIVMVYFEYTSEDFIIPDICTGYNYKLLKHFSDLLLHIHKLKRTDNLAKYELPLDGKCYMKPVGEDLQTAVRGATTYEKSQPDWFSQKYGYFRSVSNAADKCGFESGLLQEKIYLDPVSAQLQNYLDATSHDIISVTPSGMLTKDGYACMAISSHSFHQHTHSDTNQEIPLYETPTTAASGRKSDFIPPDSLCESDIVSKTISEQMMSINNRNIYG